MKKLISMVLIFVLSAILMLGEVPVMVSADIYLPPPEEIGVEYDDPNVYFLINGKKVSSSLYFERLNIIKAKPDGWAVFEPNDEIRFVIKDAYWALESITVRFDAYDKYFYQTTDDGALWKKEFSIGESVRDYSFTISEIVSQNPGHYSIQLGWYLDDGNIGWNHAPFSISDTLPSPTNDTWFTDVLTNHWAYNEIKTLTEKGVISGYPDGTFRPNSLVTRNEFAKMMVLALDMRLQSHLSSSFVDITADAWELTYVETAKRYLTGYQDGNDFYFKGNEYAVREDMAVALVKALSLDSPDNAADDPDINAHLQQIFSDYDAISPNLRKYVLIAYKQDLISGYPDGMFGAQNPITRAETATLLVKVLKSEAMTKVTFD